jgi:hypothetical protein
MCSLKVEIIKMRHDLINAIWRCTVCAVSLLTALLVMMLGILAISIVKL